LDQLAAGRDAGLASQAQVEALGEAAGLFWSVQAAARLLTEGAFDPEKVGEGGRRFLLRETGEETVPGLAARMAEAAEAASAAAGELVGEP
jgi:glutamate-ammonia-ligase adenylyltransferase